jgi:DNA-binding protein YbaB
MFDKFKQLGDLNKMRQQAKSLQKELELIKETVEEGDYKVTVTGDQKIAYIEYKGEEQKKLAEVINKAFKSVQKKAAKKMMEMGGGLSGLLGN